MDFGGNWCSFLQLSSDCCSLVQLSADWCPLGQVGVVCYNLVQMTISGQLGALWWRLVPFGGTWWRLVQFDTT